MAVAVRVAVGVAVEVAAVAVAAAEVDSTTAVVEVVVGISPPRRISDDTRKLRSTWQNCVS